MIVDASRVFGYYKFFQNAQVRRDENRRDVRPLFDFARENRDFDRVDRFQQIGGKFVERAQFA